MPSPINPDVPALPHPDATGPRPRERLLYLRPPPQWGGVPAAGALCCHWRTDRLHLRASSCPPALPRSAGRRYGLSIRPPSLRPSASPCSGIDPGPWPQILSSVGFQPQTTAAADIVVLRPGAPAVPQLTERVEQGAFVIVEGASPCRRALRVSRRQRSRGRSAALKMCTGPSCPSSGRKRVELPRFEIPKMARVFAKERWTGAPLIAGYTQRRAAPSCGSRPTPASTATSASPTSCKRCTISAWQRPSARRALGVLRLLLPHARRSRLLRRALARRRHCRSARRRLAFLRCRSRARPLSEDADRSLPSPRHSGLRLDRAAARQREVLETIIPNGARRPRSCRTRSSIGASS